VVILCTEVNTDPKVGDWDGLANALADRGFNVMRFDWRGHGGSKEVFPDKFWRDQRNQTKVTGYNQSNPRGTIDLKEFQQGYYHSLVNDLQGVRLALDLKNDDKKINTCSVYIVAAGNAAPLVHLFLATEWNRPATKPTPPLGLEGRQQLITAGRKQPNSGDSAGPDYAGICFLSPTRGYTYYQGKNVNKARVDDQTLKNWVSNFSRDPQGGGDIRKATAFKFIVGEKTEGNAKDLKETTFFHTDLLNVAGKTAPKIDPMKNSDIYLVKGAKESGADLLGKDNAYKVETKLFEWIEKVETERKRLNPIDRKYDKTPLSINWSSFNVN
jgi:hypothetical protein